MGGKHKNTYRNKDFTDVEIEILSKNPNIKSVSAKQINYTDSFKMHFLDEYAAGKLPLQIFIEAGFDQKKGHSGRKNTLNGQISTED